MLLGTSPLRSAFYDRHRHLLARRPALRPASEVMVGALLDLAPVPGVGSMVKLITFYVSALAIVGGLFVAVCIESLIATKDDPS
jgi:hypothetical protein